MNEIEVFEFQGRRIRSLCINEEPYFVGKDVAIILGYKNHRDALKVHVDEDDKKDGVAIYDSIGRKQVPVLINESGLYSLILSSKLPQAKEFKRWVTKEVLPSIRKKGFYNLNNSNEAIQLKELLNNMIELSKSLIDIAQSTSVMYKESLNQYTIKKDTYDKEVNQSDIITNFNDFDYPRCKVETFPKEIRQLINVTLEEMVKQQELNYSKIAKMCISKGYNITSPSIKTYYEKYFATRNEEWRYMEQEAINLECKDALDK